MCFAVARPADVPALQVEYANKAVEAAGVAVAVRCTDGVVLGVERLLHSKLLVKGANRRIQSVDEHIGMATAGLLADGKHLGSRARDEAANFRDTYNAPVTVQVSRGRKVLIKAEWTVEGKGWAFERRLRRVEESENCGEEWYSYHQPPRQG
jgi:hypothetical protein